MMAGTLGVGMGQWFQQIGLLWLMKVLTESPVQVGFLAAIRGGALLVAAPIAGVLADRMSRRTLIVIITVASAAQALALAVLVQSGRIEVWHLYAFTILEATFNGVNQPVRQAFVYDISSRETITNAISLNAMVQSLSRIVGPNLAGALIGFVGIASCFFVLVGMKLASAVSTLMISESAGGRSAGKQESPLTSLVGGIKYAATDTTILAIIVMTSIIPLLIYPYVQFLPFFADRVFNSGAQGYGLLASALGLGAVPGGLLIAFLGNFRGKGLTMICAYLGYAGMIILFSQQQVLLLGVACLVIAGVFHSVAVTLTFTLLQLWVRDDMRGRVIALHSMEGALQPLSSVPMGFAISRFGPPITVTVATSIAALFIGLTALLAPQLRREPDVARGEEPAAPLPEKT